MDLLDRLLGHDTWTTRQLLLLCRRLTDEQLDREFDIAHRTVRATFVHIIYNLEAWSDCMAGQPIRAEQGQSVSELIARLDRAANDFAVLSKEIADRDVWNPASDPPRSAGGLPCRIVHGRQNALPALADRALIDRGESLAIGLRFAAIPLGDLSHGKGGRRR